MSKFYPNILISRGLYRLLIKKSTMNLPNEYGCLIIGFNNENQDIATGIEEIKITTRSKDSLGIDFEDIIRRMRDVYYIGVFHSHPDGFPDASQEDMLMFEIGEMLSYKFYNRTCYHIILALSPVKLAVYYNRRRIPFQIAEF